MRSDEERLREELKRALRVASESQAFATESVMRAAAADNRITDLEARLLRLRLELRQYRTILNKVGRSRSVRAATAVARLVRRQRERPVWQDPDRLREYVDGRVERSVKAKVKQPRPIPALEVPTAAGRRDSIRAGVASISTRAHGLLHVIEDLYDQVDEIYVYLNDYKEPPAGLVRDSRVKIFAGPDLGDRGKFRFVEGFCGYYFSVDDDIHYPAFYVEQMVDGIERYDRHAIVGWHGSIVPDPFIDYYMTGHREVLHLYEEVPKDTFVHILGTGCCAFHSDAISLSIEDFTQPNMADIFLAEKAQSLQVPRVTLAHGKNWAQPLTLTDRSSIYLHSMKEKDGQFNVRSATNRRIAAAAPWTMYTAPTRLVRRDIRVAVAHQTSVRQTGRCAILKTDSSVGDMLAPFGPEIRVFGFDRTPNDIIRDEIAEFMPQILMIYGGDPTSPDLEECVELIDICAAGGSVVLVDLSVNMRESRSERIVDIVETWRSRYGDQIRLMVYTKDVIQAAGLEKVEDLAVVTPRPLEVDTRHSADFHDSEGVLLSSFDELCDHKLMSEPLETWIDAIRGELPSVPLYAFGDHGSELPSDLGVEIIAGIDDSVAERLAKVRLMVSPLRHHPFETGPIEAAAVGVPVVYRKTEQSLSAYLGTGGAEVSSPIDLGGILPLLYNDPSVWRARSRAGMRRAQSVDYRATRGELYSVLSRLVR